jgi:predicted membrane protein
MYLRKRRFIACVIGALPIGVIVGSYLWLFFPFLSPPEVFNALPAWAAMITSITASTLIATAVLGYLLLSILSRKNVLEPLRSHGLKVISQE